MISILAAMKAILQALSAGSALRDTHHRKPYDLATVCGASNLAALIAGCESRPWER